MSRLFKPTYTIAIPENAVPCSTPNGRPAVRFTRSGKTITAEVIGEGRCRVESAKWNGEYIGADGRKVRAALSENKVAAESLLANLIRQADLRRVGIIDKYTDHRAKPLADHLADFIQSHTSAGNSEKQTRQTADRIRRIITGCGWTRLADLDADAVSNWLAERRATSARFGLQTSNHYISAIRSFANWLNLTDRVPSDPLKTLGKSKRIETDRRVNRRALTADEFARLLEAAEGGRTFRNTSGPDRRRLYLAAALTGLRASELASLTRESFRLDTDPPAVVVEAAHSKHRRRDEVPLHVELVRELRSWIESLPPGMPLWPGNWARNCEAADMIRHDLGAARRRWLDESNGPTERAAREQSDFLRYRTSDGEQADFHSLRYRFVSAVVAAGAHPTEAKALARHSSITLTMDVYHRLRIADTAGVLNRIADPIPKRSGPSANPSQTMARPAMPG